MNNLEEKLCSLLISSAKFLTIVADADDLLAYPEIAQLIEQKGYRIMRASSHLEVRLKFELEMRNSRENILLIAPSDYIPLPDIEELVHFVKPDFKDLFPKLNSKAITGLDFSSLANLYRIRQFENLDERKTLEFILQNVYMLDARRLSRHESPEDALNLIIEILSKGIKINGSITEFILHTAQKSFPDLTEETLQEENFYRFLQDLWEKFISGKTVVDFTEYALNKNLNHLFANNHLKPLKTDEVIFQTFGKEFPLGIFQADNTDKYLSELIKYIEEQKDRLKSHDDWLKIIESVSLAKLFSFNAVSPQIKQDFDNLCRAVNRLFQIYIDQNYSSLFSLSGVKKPVTVTRILDHIRFYKAPKKILFVIDGMNYWQWLLITEELKAQNITFQSNASFAYIPSITAWSRQAIFKGDLPDLAKTNSTEGKLFREYWLKNGFQDYQITYRNQTLKSSDMSISFSESTEILGFVTNDLDDMMHGTVMGDLEIREKTKLWIKNGGLIEQIKKLKESGYKIFMTADHGSIEASGIKNFKLKDKLGSLSRSKRHIEFSNEVMLENFKDQNKDIDFGTVDLSVYLKNNEAFATENDSVVTHGGSHFFEVIVPFITI